MIHLHFFDFHCWLLRGICQSIKQIRCSNCYCMQHPLPSAHLLSSANAYTINWPPSPFTGRTEGFSLNFGRSLIRFVIASLTQFQCQIACIDFITDLTEIKSITDREPTTSRDRPSTLIELPQMRPKLIIQIGLWGKGKFEMHWYNISFVFKRCTTTNLQSVTVSGKGRCAVSSVMRKSKCQRK